MKKTPVFKSSPSVLRTINKSLSAKPVCSSRVGCCCSFFPQPERLLFKSGRPFRPGKTTSESDSRQGFPAYGPLRSLLVGSKVPSVCWAFKGVFPELSQSLSAQILRSGPAGSGEERSMEPGKSPASVLGGIS